MSFDLEAMRAQLPVRVTDAITDFLLIKNGPLAHFFACLSAVSLRPTSL